MPLYLQRLKLKKHLNQQGVTPFTFCYFFAFFGLLFNIKSIKE